jgi:AcrR family transcriptional regulator
MARPKSKEKRDAILAAAAKVFAERGLPAPTSAISHEAGVAEGTLFTYFLSKEDLVNALYRELKLGLAHAMMSSFPRRKSVRARLQHVWNAYVQWGIENPGPCNVLAQIEVSEQLTPESKAAGQAPFLEIETLAQDAMAQHLLKHIPRDLIAAAMQAMALATMKCMLSHPKMAGKYREMGFEVLWAGIAGKGSPDSAR